MRRLISVAILVFMAALITAGVPVAIRSAEANTYNLWAFRGEVMSIICTGTVAKTADGPRFLTAGHCVDWAPGARYWISQGSDPDKLLRVWLKWYEFSWPTDDFAVFEVPDELKSSLSLCKLLPAVGEDVWTWTGPLGIMPILRQGMYSGELHFPGDPVAEEQIGGMMFVQTNGAPGSSGSSMLRLENGAACIWGLWVGGWSVEVKLDGALVVKLPQVLR